MKVTYQLLDDIALEKREFILNKIRNFEKNLLEIKSMKNLLKGFWVRKIIGTNIYKFRVNSGDRILFKYEKYEGKD